MTNNAILSIGSNMGDRHSNLRNAIQWLQSISDTIRCSDIYEMPAINGRDNAYLNAVLEIGSSHDLSHLTSLIKEYEARCGRTPLSKQSGQISIDIDIIIWNGHMVRPREFSFEFFSKGYHQLLNDAVPQSDER